jgi:2-polyprenyl-3-methyl-5-hydroxy-6-metoxy-1,4-benzoquinol methylase
MGRAKMEIDPNHVREFWDSRPIKYEGCPAESMANLETDREALARKLLSERAAMRGFLPLIRGKSVLDLGGGTGQWSAEVRRMGAASVVVVERSSALAQVGAQYLKNNNIDGVSYVVSPAEEYLPNQKFDVVLVSGLVMYLTDSQLGRVAVVVGSATRPGSHLVLRETTALKQSLVLDRKHSDKLGEVYSAHYRTRSQLLNSFISQGFSELCNEQDMFLGSSELNKFAETRLRLYLLRRPTEGL